MKHILQTLIAIGLLDAFTPVQAASLDGKAIFCLERSLTSPEALGFEFFSDTVKAHKITGYSIIEEYAAKFREIGAEQVFWRGLQNTRVSLNRATLELRIAQAELYKCEVSSNEMIKSKLQAIIDAAKKKNKI